ncbi:hypothetical protein I6B53_04180 [Schaalia sp. 19OD2882]|uniref:DUF5719 family protein n=1 Tax=Schaalia sp. 19OD2882 TaxID=2794089 RepID=UPI001C1EEFEC|nr:DUF5719 family protein [Schaalia sp. 19OD2882]QWW20297.1 hypothetical protein I6B53_04180 [Schaalia sp. 19OD2882]
MTPQTEPARELAEPPRRRRTRRRRPALLVPGAAALALAGSVALLVGGLRLPAPAAGAPTSLDVTSRPSRALLACPPGTLDPFAPQARSGATATWSSLTGHWDPSPSPVLEVGADAARNPQGIVVAGQGAGELRGLSLAGCASARGRQWILAGATTLGEDLLLVVSNPSEVPSVVTVGALGATGPLEAGGTRVTVPAGKSVSLLPASWFPDEERPALEITADGPGVVAWAQTAGLDGETPTGAGWASAVAPGTDLVIPGLVEGAGSRVRIAVPGDSPATVRLSLAGPEATTPLGQAVSVDASTVLDVPVGTVPDGASLLISSDVPVAAQVTTTTAGAAVGAGTWKDRSLSTPTRALTSLHLPGAEALTGHVEEVLSAQALRPSALPSTSGASEASADLVVHAPAGGPEATVTLAGKAHTVAAGTSAVLPLPTAESDMTSNTPVHLALRVKATTPTGPVLASWRPGLFDQAGATGTVSVSN